jgi:hypothetical protein
MSRGDPIAARSRLSRGQTAAESSFEKDVEDWFRRDCRSIRTLQSRWHSAQESVFGGGKAENGRDWPPQHYDIEGMNFARGPGVARSKSLFSLANVGNQLCLNIRQPAVQHELVTN